MWEAINSFLTKVDDFVWGPPLMILIIAGGILLHPYGCAAGP